MKTCKRGDLVDLLYRLIKEIKAQHYLKKYLLENITPFPIMMLLSKTNIKSFHSDKHK